MRWSSVGVVWAVFAHVSYVGYAVDRSKFRTCEKSGFCKRARSRSGLEDEYHVVEDSVKASGSQIIANVGVSGESPLQLAISALRNGVVRVRITEHSNSERPPRYESPDVLLQDLVAKSDTVVVEKHDKGTSFTVKAQSSGVRVRVGLSPFRIDVLDGESVSVAINQRGLFHMDQRHRSKGTNGVDSANGEKNPSGASESERKIKEWGEDGKPVYEDGDGGGEDGEADAAQASQEDSNAIDIDAPESFGGFTDSRPNGATSVNIDVGFPRAMHVFGLPEHATAFSLKTTKGANGGYQEPYRMYNLDVFEYEIDEPMALYGHIPVVVAHSAEGTAMVFWNNPSETFVDITDDAGGNKQVHWMSESGVAELFVMTGPGPLDVFRQYASVTGVTPVPPMFSLGYHQCRWNYRDEKDVAEVNAKFEELDLPMDVLWLDIEHTDGKRYFTWDKDKFPTPEAMQQSLWQVGRRMVTIVDPHIKSDSSYYVHSEASRLGLYIKDKDGSNDFKGWCWPGDSHYLDFTQPKVRDWWAEQFSLDHYKGSTPQLFTWNDMNEPSVFNGPEVSMTKEARNLVGVEHREWHNLYGFYQHMATARGLEQREKQGSQHLKRPFVLSRSFFAGSQRHGAIWTGDNAADWTHLRIASDMLLSLNVAGLPFAGADVGGFFKNPDTELLERWYQAGCFQPFFRAHAHIETKRREPWLFGEDTLHRIAKTLRTRYSILPHIYTAFAIHERDGSPVMRPLWTVAPRDANTFPIGNQWLLGGDIMVRPVVDAGHAHAEVYVPKDTAWYQFEFPHAIRLGGPQGSTFTESAPINAIPAYFRAGSIVARKMRLRRSSVAMQGDPYSLFVALDPTSGGASGELYVDDEESFAYRGGQRCWVNLHFRAPGEFAAAGDCGAGFSPIINVERIVVLGLSASPQSVTLAGNGEAVPFAFDASSNSVTVRKPLKSFLTVPFQLHFARLGSQPQ